MRRTKKLRRYFILCICMLFLLPLFACGSPERPTQQNPVTLTIWHTYVEGMSDSFNELVNEFNATAGLDNHITIKVTAIANASVINEQIIAAASNDPGAPALPDMAVLYPDVAATLMQKGVLANIGKQFTEEELAAYVPQFIEEGRLGGDTLYVLPIAKSTEVLYLNRTLFDRFSAATGVNEDSLSTFEGITDAAKQYYEWTDAQTPEPGDGKMFYYPDDFFNYAMIGCEQMGGSILQENNLSLNSTEFQRIWDSYYTPAVKGGVAIYNDYGNYLAATGDIVCCSSTSAGASFYPSRVTYADNTKEDVVFDVLPYPVFEGGEKVAFQRGGGICVTSSEPAREYAAGLFIKWFTEAEHNLRFTASTGYIPVQTAAFEDILSGNLPEFDDYMVEKSLVTVANMTRDYRFYFPPVFDGFDDMQTKFVEKIQSAALFGREEYLSYQRVPDNALQNFLDQYTP